MKSTKHAIQFVVDLLNQTDLHCEDTMRDLDTFFGLVFLCERLDLIPHVVFQELTVLEPADIQDGYEKLFAHVAESVRRKVQ